MLGPNLATRQLYRLKMPKSLSSNSVIKMEEETKQKQGRSPVGDTLKMTWNVGSVNEN